MKNHYLPFLFLVLCISLTQNTMAQNGILYLQEKDQNGKTHEVKTQKATLDLNSSVTVKIDKKALREKINALMPNNNTPPDTSINTLLTDYKALDVVMESYTDDLKNVGNEVEKKRLQRIRSLSPTTDTTNLNRAFKVTDSGGDASKFLAAMDALESMGLGDELDSRLEMLNESRPRSERISILEQYNVVFGLLNEHFDRSPLYRENMHTTDDTETEPDLPNNSQHPTRGGSVATSTAPTPTPEAQPDALYVQMGAWIVTNEGTRAIKIPGFDDYEQGRRIEIPRNALSIDAKQTAQLQQYKSAFAGHQLNIDQVLNTCKQPYVDMLNEWVADVENAKTSITSLISNIKRSKLKNILPSTETVLDDRTQSYLNYITSLKNKYLQKAAGGQLKNLLADAKTDVKELAIETKNFLSIRDILSGELRVGDPLLTQDLTQVIANVSKIEQRVYEAQSYVRNFATLLPGTEVNLDAIEFSDKVYKLSVDKMPEEAEFNLLYSGQRKQGDMVVLKIAVGHTADTDKQPKDLETRTMRLLNVPPHLDMVVNYAFARPTRNFNDFLPNGPAYSVVFKFTSRSLFYRNFIDAGVGLNFATFDFNRDGNPEIAAGAAFSCFRDYLQGGVGFNFSRNTPYLHAGLRIPFPTMGIGFNGRSSNNTDALQFDPGQ
ncbi:MAG: hypothetical protein KA783_06715 [Chitinophagales bacterium]|nr:hypothetical protein [Sphingobacteriales bacterium]MBP7534121.1 hypothetical protein [Chitinophagales bacterium]